MLHPDFPVVEGRYQLTADWFVTLPGEFNRRIEEGDMVLWRPGITVWLAVWNNEAGQAREDVLGEIRKDTSPDAFDIEMSKDAKLLRFSYRLREEEEQGAAPSFYCFAIGKRGHVQMAIYLDDEADLETAKAIFASIEEVSAV